MIKLSYKKSVLAEIIATMAGMLSLIAYAPQTYRVYLTNQTNDLEINTFIIIFITLILWCLWGALLGSISIIAFAMLQLCFVGYIILKTYKNNKHTHIHIHNHNNLN